MLNELGESFWSRLVTVYETWLPFYLPETKEQSRQWCRRRDKPPLKAKTVPSLGKVMVTVFGIVRESFLLTICKRASLSTVSSVPLLQQDNARPHTAALTTTTISRLGWTLLVHPPYSPDLTPSDYHLFSALKQPLRGHHFASLDEIKSAVNAWIRETPPSFFDFSRAASKN